MAKVRVSDIANELGVKSKDVIAFLQSEGLDFGDKSFQKTLSDSEETLVRGKFGGGNANTDSAAKASGKSGDAKSADGSTAGSVGASAAAENSAKANPQAAQPKADVPAKPQAKPPVTAAKVNPNPQAKPANPQASTGAKPAAEGSAKPAAKPAAQGNRPDGKPRPKGAPQKKKNLTFVFNSQNSDTGRNNTPHSRRPSGAGSQRRPAGARPSGAGGQRPSGGGLIKPRAGVDHIRKEDHAVEEPYISRKAQVNAAEHRQNADVNTQNAEAAKTQTAGNASDTSRQAAGGETHKPQGTSSISSTGRTMTGRPIGPRRTGETVRVPRPTSSERPQRGNAAGSSRGGMARGGAPGAGAGGQNSGGNANKPDSRKGAQGKRGNARRDFDSLGGKKQERFTNLEKNAAKKKHKPAPKVEEKDEIKSIKVPDIITIRDLADRMKMQPSAIIKKLFMQGEVVTLNSEVEYAKAEEIAIEFEYLCEKEEKVDVIAELLAEEEEDASKMVSRPPVVCVMGHVDHGKTSLLDAIRDTKVTDVEAGGITQAIGAYMVEINKQKITFLDTPGHEAFTAMRMRGANSTDIAILVVAADDGVMPQTVEAINHAKAAGVEIIVAVNKIDKPNANIDRVKQELSEYELIPEDWGGSTVFVPVSAKTREGIDTLLEMILLTAEVLELKANPKRNARGLVIEAQLDKGRGTVATVLVQKGTLRVGDPVAAGSSFGKVRAMIDDNGKRVKVAGPSTPVEILGLSEVPNAGEIFVSLDSEKDARSFAQTFVSESRNKLVEDTKMKMSLDDLYSQIQSGSVKELNIIVKADVQGSVEALKQSLIKLSNDEVVVKIIHGGVGAITESDVTLASASNAIIIGFNVRPDAMAKQTAEAESVDIRLYSVIYNAIDDVEAAMKGMLDPIFEEQIIGHAEVRQIFKSSDVGNIAGSYILDGYFERGCKCRVKRGDEQIYEGELASLKRFKDDVKEVKAGFECGIVVDGFSEVMVEDTIEAFKMVEVPR